MNPILNAVVNGMIVSAGLAVVVQVAFWLMPARLLNAATRYAIWWVVMAAVGLLPLAYVPFGSERVVVTKHVVTKHVVKEPVGFLAAPVARAQVPATPIAPFRSAPRPSVALPPLWTRVVSRPFFPVVITVGPWSARIIFFWLGLSVLMLVRLVVSVVMLERRKARAAAAPLALTEKIFAWLRWRRDLRVLCSSEIPIPIAAGPWRPSVLLPARLLETLSEDDLTKIGIHEAGHLARRDDYALTVQRGLEALLILHPVVWWVSRRIDLEREIACDDLVVEATGDAQPYAACLARVVELSGAVRAVPMAAAATDRSHLAKRVAMLLDSSCNHATGLSKLRLVLALVCVAGISWGGVQGRRFLMFTAGPVRVVTVTQAPRTVIARPRIRLLAQAAAPAAPAAPKGTSTVPDVPANYLQMQQQTLDAMETLRENLEGQRSDSAAVMVDLSRSLDSAGTANKLGQQELQRVQNQFINLMNQVTTLTEAEMAARQRDKQQQIDDAMVRLEELARRQQELANQSKNLQPTELPREQYEEEMLRRQATRLRQAVQELADAQYGLAHPQPAPAVASSNLVYIPVEVRDPMGRFVTGLERDIFHVREDGVDQNLVQLLAEDAPTAIFLIGDSRFPSGADFSKANGVVIPIQADGSKISAAVRMAGQAARGYPGGRKIVMIVAGSSVNTAGYADADLKSALVDSSMPVYVFEVPDFAPAGQQGILSEIASRSGGQFVPVAKAEDLPDAINNVLIGVRNRYFIGYSPSNAVRDGSYRNVEVTINPPRGLPKLTAHSPAGYYATAQ